MISTVELIISCLVVGIGASLVIGTSIWEYIKELKGNKKWLRKVQEKNITKLSKKQVKMVVKLVP